MENQLEGDFQGMILQLPRHQWRIFLMEKIDAYEVRYITVLDVPNAFIQTKIPPKKDD